MIFFIARPWLISVHELLMTIPYFRVVDLCYAEKQVIVLDFLQKLI